MEERLFQILEAERALHPRMDVIDVQKLVYQAVFGIDHLLLERRTFEQSLQGEWGRLNTMETYVRGALQIIDPMGRTARLHLGPCQAMGIDPEELTVFLFSQPLKKGKRMLFDRLWRSVTALSRNGRIPFKISELIALPFPGGPVHHSSNYGTVVYRVINDVTHPPTGDWLEKHGVTQ
jgi:hypothetical protein